MRPTRHALAHRPGPLCPFRGAALGALLAAALPTDASAQPRQLGEGRVVAAAPVAAPAAARPVATTLRLQADLAERTLYVWAGDSLLHLFPVAVGKTGHATPTGSFTIDRVIWNPDWVPPDAKWARGKRARGPADADNPMQAVKLFFREPDYYIHGTNRPETVGSAASHGCLRMRPEDAAELARLVMEHAGEPRDAAWVAETLRAKSTRTVRLPMRVAMTVE